MLLQVELQTPGAYGCWAACKEAVRNAVVLIGKPWCYCTCGVVDVGRSATFVQATSSVPLPCHFSFNECNISTCLQVHRPVLGHNLDLDQSVCFVHSICSFASVPVSELRLELNIGTCIEQCRWCMHVRPATFPLQPVVSEKSRFLASRDDWLGVFRRHIHLAARSYASGWVLFVGWADRRRPRTPACVLNRARLRMPSAVQSRSSLAAFFAAFSG